VRVMILTPSRGTISLAQRDMLLRLAVRLKDSGHHMSFADDTTSGLLSHSRNLLLGTSVLRSHQLDWLLWLDADISFGHESILEMMWRPEEIIAWTYPMRIPFDVLNPPEPERGHAELLLAGGSRWTAWPRYLSDGSMVWSPDQRLVELEQCGFGAVLMRPQVARRMYHLAPRKGVDWTRRFYIPGFDLSWDSFGNLSSEDISFCRKIRAEGHRIWCDPRPYVTNGQTGGRFDDELSRSEERAEFLSLFSSLMSD
jgi:hypothetical protein